MSIQYYNSQHPIFQPLSSNKGWTPDSQAVANSISTPLKETPTIKLESGKTRDVNDLYDLILSLHSKMDAQSKELTELAGKVKELMARPDFTQYSLYKCDFCSVSRTVIALNNMSDMPEGFGRIVRMKCPGCACFSKIGVNYSGDKKDLPAAKENLVAELINKKALTLPEQETKVNQK